jgi:perosamine synthetase
MTNICAAIGLAQLEQVDDFIKRKREIADNYNIAFKNLDIEFHQESIDVYHSYWMCSILVKQPEDRDKLRDFLAERGIETRPLFYPVHTMPMFSEKFQKHGVAENLGWRGINLPSYPSMSNEQQFEIINCVKMFFNENH